MATDTRLCAEHKSFAADLTEIKESQAKISIVLARLDERTEGLDKSLGELRTDFRALRDAKGGQKLLQTCAERLLNPPVLKWLAVLALAIGIVFGSVNLPDVVRVLVPLISGDAAVTTELSTTVPK